MDTEQYVSAAYIAKHVVGLSADTVRRQAKAGNIPAYKLGTASNYLFLVSEVRAALKPAKPGSWAQSARSRSKRRAA